MLTRLSWRLGVVSAVTGLLTLSSGCAPSAAPAAGPSAGRPGAAASVTAPSSEPGQGGERAVGCDYRRAGEPARPVDPPPATAPATGTTAVTLSFAVGDVTITVDRAQAPCTVNSFESLATQGFYTGTRCHRLADNGLFMLQCGDPTGTGGGGPGYTFADEVDPKADYPAGTVAMANAGPDTNGSQFFLVYQDSPLPAAYTVFGHLDDASTAVVGRIAAEGQDGSWGDGTGRPNNLAAITAVRLG